MEIMHLRKYRERGRGDGGAAYDAEIGWLQGHDYDERDDDHCESDKKFF